MFKDVIKMAAMIAAAAFLISLIVTNPVKRRVCISGHNETRHYVDPESMEIKTTTIFVCDSSIVK